MSKMAYLYNGILLINWKDKNTDICYNMDIPQKLYAQWKKLNTMEHMVQLHLYEIYRTGKFIKIENLRVFLKLVCRRRD